MFKETNNNTNIYAWNCCFCFTVTQLCLTLVTSWTVALQSLLSMGFPRQEYWKWAAISSSRGSSQLRDRTQVSCIGRQILYHWATREAHTWNRKLYKVTSIFEKEMNFQNKKYTRTKTTEIMVVFGCRLDTSEEKISNLEEIVDILWVK